MDTVDQAFWQLFHSVEAAMGDAALLEKLPPPDADGSVALGINGPPHAVGILRREAERRGVSYPALIGQMSEERRGELPAWWLMIARANNVGVLSETK